MPLSYTHRPGIFLRPFLYKLMLRLRRHCIGSNSHAAINKHVLTKLVVNYDG